MPKTKSVPAPPKAEACYQAMIKAMRPFADDLGPAGMLAIASNLVGKLIALQDQRTMTREMALELVARNIEAANA